MTSAAASEPVMRGALALEGSVGVVRMELDVPVSRAEVWSAVTDPQRLGRWLGEVKGDLRAGGRYQAHLFPSGWVGTGEVLECEPGRRWIVEGGEAGRHRQTDELTLADRGDGTRVVVTEKGMASEKVAFYGVGVQIHVENLAAYLAGDDVVDPDLYWDRLLPVYQAMAATL